MEYLENRSFNITLTSKGRKKSREPFIFKGSRDLLIIQTPLRTAFHDTQRLLLETYASNMCSDFVLFAQLMKK